VVDFIGYFFLKPSQADISEKLKISCLNRADYADETGHTEFLRIRLPPRNPRFSAYERDGFLFRHGRSEPLQLHFGGNVRAFFAQTMTQRSGRDTFKEFLQLLESLLD
jgi:hypothetical protein